MLIVAGRFDPDRTLAQIAKTFGPIPRPTRTLPVLYTKEPVQDGERSVTVRRAGGAQFVAALYHTVPGAHPDAIAMEALGEVMTVEPAGRLYRALVETKKASAVESWNFVLADPGDIIFWAQVPPGDSLDAARDVLIATVEGVKREADHRGGSGSRARQGAAAVRRNVQRSAEARRRDFGVDRDRRLAPFLPAARSMAQVDARATCSAWRSNT